MVVGTLAPPASVTEAFTAVRTESSGAQLATVDRRGRPRSRLVHPDLGGDRPRARRLAHLASDAAPARPSAATPYVSCSYWDPAHDVAVAECAARGSTTRTRSGTHGTSSAAPPPAGYDPATIWPDGPRTPAPR